MNREKLQEIEQLEDRLRIHRVTLTHYLKQQAQLGILHVPPGVIHGIAEARYEIRYIKDILRKQGMVIEDQTDDEFVNLDDHILLDTTKNKKFLRILTTFSFIVVAIVVLYVYRSKINLINPSTSLFTTTAPLPSPVASQVIATSPLSQVMPSQTTAAHIVTPTEVPKPYSPNPRASAEPVAQPVSTEVQSWPTKAPVVLPSVEKPNANEMNNTEEKIINVTLSSLLTCQSTLLPDTIKSNIEYQDYIQLHGNDSDLDTTPIFNQGWVKIKIQNIVKDGFAVDVDPIMKVSSHIITNVPQHVNYKSPECADDVVSFSDIVLDTDPIKQTRQVTDTEGLDKHFPIKSGEFEEFMVHFRCESVGIYDFSLTLYYTYSKGNESITAHYPRQVVCTERATLWYDGGSANFVLSDGYYIQSQ